MCTGSRALVRSVTAAAAACGSRFSVAGSMSAKTGRAPRRPRRSLRRRTRTGLSRPHRPSLHPDRAQREVQARGAARDGAGVRRADEAREIALELARAAAPATAARERAPRAPPRSSASPITGRASGISASLTRRPRSGSWLGESARRCMPYSRESTSASQEAAIRFSETPIVPHTSLRRRRRRSGPGSRRPCPWPRRGSGP